MGSVEHGAQLTGTWKKRHPLISDVRRRPLLYLMVLPAVVGIVLFRYLPAYNMVIAFQNFDLLDGVWGSDWVGLKWFLKFFRDPFFVRLIRNTFLLAFFSLVWGFWPPILLALLFHELRFDRFRRVSQSISYLPHFLPTVVMAGLVLELFSTDGLVNRIIGAVGIEGVRFFNEPGWFRPLYIGSGIWQQVGWSSIIYLAALSGVNPELYESAYMDGAGRLRRAWHVSLPGIAPTIYLLFILAVGQLMSVGFEKPFLLQNPAIYETADVIETYVYRRGIINQEYGYSAAVGLFNSAINLALLLVANRLTGRYTQHSLW